MHCFRLGTNLNAFATNILHCCQTRSGFTALHEELKICFGDYLFFGSQDLSRSEKVQMQEEALKYSRSESRLETEKKKKRSQFYQRIFFLFVFKVLN